MARIVALSLALMYSAVYAQGLLPLFESCHCTHPADVPCDCPHMGAADDDSKLPPCHRKLLAEKRAAAKEKPALRNRCAPPPLSAVIVVPAELPEAVPLAERRAERGVVSAPWSPATEHVEEPNAPPPRT